MAEITNSEIEKTEEKNAEAENRQPNVKNPEPLKTELEFLKAMPETVDSGSEVTLQAEVSCEKDGFELVPAGKVVIFDADGNIAAEAPLLTADELKRIEREEAEALIPKDLPEGHPRLQKPTEQDMEKVLGHRDEKSEKIRARTTEFTLKVPSQTGEYTWTAKYEPEEFFDEEENARDAKAAESESNGNPEKEKTVYFNHLASSVVISFKVRLHLISIMAWDIPRPVIGGEPFKISVGACCSNGCSMAGLRLKIKTENETQTAVLGNEILANTKATTWAEVTLRAPADEALHEWTVGCEASETGIAHQVEGATIIFQTAPKPEHTVRIAVVEKHSKKPLPNAYVMFGRYQGETNKEGISEVKVPAGKHTLSVTLKDWSSESIEAAVTGDMTVTAEMNFTPNY